MPKTRSRQPVSWFAKAFYLVVIGGLVVLGVIGLVLPIIPGLVFLVLALLLLARVSTRVHALVGGQSWFRRLRRSWQRLTLLNPADRARLAFWYCVQSIVSATNTVVRFVDRGVRRLQGRSG